MQRRSHLRAADGVDLVAVALRLQAVPQSGFEDAAGFLGGEHARLAEHVAELAQAVPCGEGDHLLRQQADVARAILPVLRRQCVRAEEGGDQLDRLLPIQLLHRAQHLQLRLGVQAVAGLGLTGRHSQGEHPLQLPCRLRLQCADVRLARAAHGGQDAAPCGEDVEVGDAAQLHGQLVLPPAAEHQMGVRIDEARRDELSARVEALRAVRRSSRADRCDDPVFDGDPGILQQMDVALFAAAARAGADRRCKHADVFNHKLHTDPPLVISGASARIAASSASA